MFSRRQSLAALLWLLAPPVAAQKFTAAIRGNVTDPSRAVIAGAQVTLENEETGLTRTATTNEAGNYSFPDLPVGSYRVEVVFTGFKTTVRTGVVVNVADVREVNVELAPGELAVVISVEATSSAVKTVGAEIAGLTSGDQVRELPLNGRNLLQLTLLQPGVTPSEGLNTVNKGLMGASNISVSGGGSNMWLVDGADNMDHGSNGSILVYPSLDAIEEFKIQRNNYGAEFGQAGGAQVNVVTKGGTNTFHGSGYYFARRGSWNAVNYFVKQAGLPRPPLEWDDFGATLGGPILKDKLHFFVSYEKSLDDRSDVRSGFVPTAAERAGDFSGAPLGGCTPDVPSDPLTGEPFPGHVIPADRLSPAGLAYLELYQLPTHTPSSGCSNYTQTVPTPVNWDQINARVDWNISNSTRAMVRYTQDGWRADNTILWGDSPYSVVGSDWEQPGRSLVAQLTRTIGSSMTNSLTFSYSANVITASRTGDSAAVDQVNDVLPTVYPASVKERGGAAQPLFWGAGPYGAVWNQAPWKNNQDLYVLKDDFSAVFGGHFLKAGLFLSTTTRTRSPPTPRRNRCRRRRRGLSRSRRLRPRPDDRQPPRGPVAPRHGLRHERAQDEQERAAALAGPRVLHGRLLQGESPRHRGLRRALQPPGAAVDGRRPAGELRPLDGRPGPGRLALQRHAVPARDEPVSRPWGSTVEATPPPAASCPRSSSGSRRASGSPGTSPATARRPSAEAWASSTSASRWARGWPWA